MYKHKIIRKIYVIIFLNIKNAFTLAPGLIFNLLFSYGEI